MIERARNYAWDEPLHPLLVALADALARHSAPLPPDVAGLVDELRTSWAVEAQIDLHERAASLIASQAREIEEWKQTASVEAGLRREFKEHAEAAEARVRELELKLGDEIYNRECADKLVAAAEARATAHDALLAALRPFANIPTAPDEPGRSTTGADVLRARTAIRLAEGTEP